MPRLRWILLLVGSSLLVLIMATTIWFEVVRVFNFTRMINERAAELENKRENIERNREMIEFYQTKDGIAHLGRELYNFVYPGERIFIIEER